MHPMVKDPTFSKIKKPPNAWIVLVIVITFGVFAALANHVKSGGTFVVDDIVFSYTFSLRSNLMNSLMRGVTFLGSSFFLLPANILIILWVAWYMKDKFFAFQWTVSAIGSLLLMYFFKGIYERPRPLDPYLEIARGFSFPSGHTLNGLVFFGLVICLLNKYVSNKYFKMVGTILLIIIILGIGLSRVYLRAHYASDIIGGLTLGTGWLMLSIYLSGALKKSRFFH